VRSKKVIGKNKGEYSEQYLKCMAGVSEHNLENNTGLAAKLSDAHAFLVNTNLLLLGNLPKISKDEAGKEVTLQLIKLDQEFMAETTVAMFQRRLDVGIENFTIEQMNERNTRLATFIYVKVAVEETKRMFAEGKGFFADIEDDDGVIRPAFIVLVSV
jgi:hypothetical protein